MIFDSLDNLNHYRGIHPNLDLAIEFLSHHDVGKDDLGRYEIDGKHVFYFIQENTLDVGESENFEFHNRYLDLHFPLRGHEVIKYGTEIDEIRQVYDRNTDFAAGTSVNQVDFTLMKGNFIAFLPKELHQPNRYAEMDSVVRKCVVKVLMEE